MDPFSIVIGVASLLDITWRVAKYLKDVQEGAGIVEGEILSLLSEIKSLDAVNRSIKHLHETEVEMLPEGVNGLPHRDQELWQNTANNLSDCQVTVERLHEILESIAGKHGEKVAGWRDGIRKQLRKQSKDGELSSIRLQISVNRQSLHISLTMLDLIYTKRGSDNVRKLGFQLHRQISALQERITLTGSSPAHESLGRATGVASSLHLNEHFDTPKTVSSIFTGRESYLNGLKQAFDLSISSTEKSSMQKRFVIYGLGGSGKTQFCCKFASDNKHRFWAVFTVDASSQDTAQQSFVAIAKLSGIDPNERAAKSWLSSNDRPWLLLIDNADDAKLEVEKYLPDGEHGLTLITTRNPSIKMYGTIGQRFYHFDRLDDEEAGQLLLRAADYQAPLTPLIIQWTKAITRTLGGLPLALIHAGNAIKAKYCGWSDYLIYYDRSWEMIRQSRGIDNNPDAENANLDEYIQVYSSYEILYRGLEAMPYQRFKDALQLLQLFSFFHHEHLPFDVLIAAVRHPKLEREAEESTPAPGNPSNTEKPTTSWLKRLYDLVIASLEKHYATRNQTVLPTFLCDAEHSHPSDDFNVRLRKALHELIRLSLITYHEASDSYSMHPLVHTWVRERPQMTTKDQAVWCEAAWTTLLRCILLPPLSNSVKSHKDLPRKVLPHLLAVEKRQERIRAEFESNKKTLWRPWPPPLKSSGMHPKRALQIAKSSLVYVQCGYFSDAEKRQREVMDFVYKMRGPAHPRAMDITLALAMTLWHQSRANEAADLQDQVLQQCLKSLGPEHPRTLKVMDALGEGRRQQGRITESIDLHRDAIEGMKTKLPKTDPALYHALEHLGATLWYCYRFEEAKQHQEQAVAGLKELLGEDDLITLIAIESLARTYRSLGVKYLEVNKEQGQHYLEMADINMTFVLDERIKQLGDKQPYTWLAKCNLGAIKGAKGELEEGERLINNLIPMASAHLGDDHLGVLAGRNELARIFIKQKRFYEAEDILLDISKQERYRKIATSVGDHPDRCDALWTLLECYQLQNKVDDGLRICDELQAVITSLRMGRRSTNTSDTFWQMIDGKRLELQASKSARPTLNSNQHDLWTRPLVMSSDAEYATSIGELRRR